MAMITAASTMIRDAVIKITLLRGAKTTKDYARTSKRLMERFHIVLERIAVMLERDGV